MTKFIATLAAASILLAVQSPVFASDRGKEDKPVANVSIKNRNDHSPKLATGLTLGAVVLGIVIASRANAEQRDHEAQCRAWRTDCRYGRDRAGYKYDTRC